SRGSDRRKQWSFNAICEPCVDGGQHKLDQSFSIPRRQRNRTGRGLIAVVLDRGYCAAKEPACCDEGREARQRRIKAWMRKLAVPQQFNLRDRACPLLEIQISRLQLEYVLAFDAAIAPLRNEVFAEFKTAVSEVNIVELVGAQQRHERRVE